MPIYVCSHIAWEKIHETHSRQWLKTLAFTASSTNSNKFSEKRRDKGEVVPASKGKSLQEDKCLGKKKQME